MTFALAFACLPAFAQEEDDEIPANIDELFEPSEPEANEAEAPAPAPAPAGDAAAAAGEAPAEGAAPAPDAPAPSPATSPAPAPVVSATRDATPDARTIAERGGLFDIGLVLAPKLGGGLGSVFLEGLGGTGTIELELGYDLPIALPVARELELFAALGYSAPSTTATVDAADARLPGDGSFTYDLTLHQLSGTYGALYRVPLDVVEWWRPYAAAGARTIWSWTVVSGSADGQAFSPYVESAFDLGLYVAAGSDFYVGPGAILVELQTAMSWPDRFVLRSTSTTAVQLALGYRFFL